MLTSQLNQKREAEHPNKNADDAVPRLITSQDFMECGIVNKYLQNNSSATDNEIALATRLSLGRVRQMRAYLQKR